MTITVSHLKLRIVLIVVTMIFLWQALRLLPWLQSTQVIGVEPQQGPAGDVMPVLVTVFYEALCPDSKSFITKQVVPTMERAPELVSFSLVPYGKAKTVADGSGNFSFACQHGPIECEGNKIHACAIEHIPDAHLLVKYISCMISNNIHPEYICERCGRELGVEWQAILKCSKSKRGNELLKLYGDMTNNLLPSVVFIPTVLLNQQFKKQSAILKNLFKEVCAMYEKAPVECQAESRISLYR